MSRILRLSFILWGFIGAITSYGQSPENEDLSEQGPDLSEIFSAPKVLWALAFLAGGYLSIRIVSKAIQLLAERTTQYRIALKGLVPVIRILGWVTIIFIIIAGIFQPPISTVLALSASVGVAVGFASQDILKNIFGGIMILFDRPFQVGDKIEVGSHYGEVTEIGLRSTRIITPDDSLVSIPNSVIMNGSVSNSNTGEANCQVVAEIYLPITIDTVRVRELATEAALVSKHIYLNKPISVLFFNQVMAGRSFYKMRLKAYVMDIRSEFAFKSEMTELVISALQQEGILKVDEGIMSVDE
ncbi:mechanosensitive ion channel family protein [Marinoscillum furvescens]|uniref:Mechanosensitive ion channel-like protein n=1 Tax=Marinoscillum furvescens DSM 4134 TaxID=1122208 RepID=A0A3D9L1R4_MARFU|nr:mechanosensitive ion channel domain-containing protein [Marinoscillum furvescens]RED97035.1 mechanosensitive ion channel-like protein [Marinoscillum furvescens DSM 4134]